VPHGVHATLSPLSKATDLGSAEVVGVLTNRQVSAAAGIVLAHDEPNATIYPAAAVRTSNLHRQTLCRQGNQECVGAMRPSSANAQEEIMATPTTRLDTVFSDPDATATSWDDTRKAIEAAEIFWIGTVRSDGRPHVTPLVAVWLDDALHFCTGDAEQKAVNLRSNQNVVLTTGCNQWDSGLDVVVEGPAVRVTDRSVLERLAEVWGHKWDGRWAYEPDDGGFKGDGHENVLVFAVRPAKVFAFAKGHFSHTRHMF
jgi:general stress protein 26